MMAEPKFKPKENQVDFTNVRHCPVINCVVKYQDKVLLVQREKSLRLYPGYWNGISGFLDDDKTLEEKVYEELREEAGISKEAVGSIKRGGVLIQESEEYKKTWIVFPVLAEVKTDKVKLDWESSNHRWLFVEEARNLNLLPGFPEVLDALFKNT